MIQAMNNNHMKVQSLFKNIISVVRQCKPRNGHNKAIFTLLNMQRGN